MIIHTTVSNIMWLLQVHGCYFTVISKHGKRIMPNRISNAMDTFIPVLLVVFPREIGSIAVLC